MRCDYFQREQCRSCALLPLSYPEQIARKEGAVQRLLLLPASAWLPPVTSPQERFRNIAKLAVGGTIAAPLLGIATATGVQDLTLCPLHESAIESALPALKAFITTAKLAPYDVASRSGELKFLLITASADGELMVRFVLRSREAESRIRKHLTMLLTQLPNLAVVSLNLHPQHAALLEGEEEIVLTERSTLAMRVNGLQLHLRPQSFFQTNTAVAEALYEQATTWIVDSAPHRVWDLYCGVGGFALHAARAGVVEVTGIEVSAEAIASAKRTATDLALDGVRFISHDATAFALAQERPADLVLVNPPRRGIGHDLAGWLEQSNVTDVIYSSCNAVSLARDLAAMPSLTPVSAVLLDMFPNTEHYEVLVRLRRTAGSSE